MSVDRKPNGGKKTTKPSADNDDVELGDLARALGVKLTSVDAVARHCDW